MQVACIILAHKDAAQLRRMIDQLRHPHIDCWIHLDKRSPIPGNSEIFSADNVFRVQPSVEVHWAGFSIVEAMLNGLKAILAKKDRYDYVIFLSGQDYPLQPPAALLQYLDSHKGDEFVGNRPYEESEQNRRRISKYYFNDLPTRWRRVLEKAANTILPERILPFPYQIRKGPQWMALSIPAVRYILQFVSENPAYQRFFRWVHAPDEFFFQTLLFNSPFRSAMKNEILHYIDWSEGRKSPKTLTMQDLAPLSASPLFFARKFDTAKDTTILDAIDERLSRHTLTKSNLS